MFKSNVQQMVEEAVDVVAEETVIEDESHGDQMEYIGTETGDDADDDGLYDMRYMARTGLAMYVESDGCVQRG